MTPGKQWADQELPLATISEHPALQFRAEGLSKSHLRKLVRTLEAGTEPLEPVRVARIGKALYLVDGHHRVEAHRRTGKATIAAKVARMSLAEAKDAARVANTKHGKGLSRADKALVWQSYVADGRHLGMYGEPKASRTIADELEQMYSHETVRQKLIAMGLELDEGEEFPSGRHKLYHDDPGAEWELEDQLAEELEADLRDFGSRFGQLSQEHRSRLLKAAQGILAAIEKGEEPDMGQLLPLAVLDI